MRYVKAFEKQGVFVPFVTLGDPTYVHSLEIIKTLIDAGASALELGFAFSDPIADGPIIQKSHLRALQNPVSMRENFACLEKVRAYNAQIPIGLLVYANLVHNFGIEEFYYACAHSGIDSVLIADVPLHESAPFVQSAHKHQINPIFIASPNASMPTLERLARLSSAYIYVLARAGVTGTHASLEPQAHALIYNLKQYTQTPCLLGFGISTPEHAQKALQMGAKGVIVGSAVVQIIETHLDDPQMMLEHLSAFVRDMRVGLCYN
ncbi:tryptophan synthase subunit alpha [Helicobacter baculiformis]|uniref:Tryptophan synthase alpha chain n=1 Tax=Helicobacter baculiformis TaxID=427351 RepID=A0ABV7ZJB1_9HELI|nr:tryptophan synthase subunit alpha [Helicobacter baculiformis]